MHLVQGFAKVQPHRAASMLIHSFVATLVHTDLTWVQPVRETAATLTSYALH